MPQNKIATIPVNPRASASKKEHHDNRKNKAVSIVAIPSNLTNLNRRADTILMNVPMPREPIKTVKNFSRAMPNSCPPVTSATLASSATISELKVLITVSNYISKFI